jgi:lysophospholipase L1-like esterase
VLGVLSVVGLLLVTAVGIAAFADHHPAAAARRGSVRETWVTSWSASPQVAWPDTLAADGFDDQTVRNIVFTSVGGDEVRLELTNRYGTRPLQVGRVTVAAAGPGASVVPGTIHEVTFGGSASFQIPVGGRLLSDPVAMAVQPLQDLAVSVYLPGPTGTATFHWDGQQANWVSTAGDHTTDEAGDAFTTAVGSWFYLSGLIVRSPRAVGTVVVFGDSITDGYQSAMGGNDRWPNDLARRLDTVAGPSLSVADEGISGNRVLAGSVFFGASAEARFEADALDVPGVRDIILLEGINDIGFSATPPHPGLDVSAAQIIAGYQRLIRQAHARGVKIFGATLLPYQGSGYYTAAGEAKREAVNAWIRTSGAFDGVIDFDTVMRDPADPLRLNPGYDSGDHLHPDDAGYRAMADAVDLQPLLATRTSTQP